MDRAQRAGGSKSGKALLRRRGQHLERSFEHILDEGGMRRATLRGRENLNKRHKVAAACYNLSQFLRRRYGVGTSRQWLAGKRSQSELLFAGFMRLLRILILLLHPPSQLMTAIERFRLFLSRSADQLIAASNSRFSTVC